MKRLICTKGIPGSGKSTLAERLIQTHKVECGEQNKSVSYVVLSTDEIISASGHYFWAGDITQPSHKTNQIKCREACKRGIELIIIDNTNLIFKEIKPYVEFAIEYGYEVEFVESNTPWAKDVEQCFQRNKHSVPRDVIANMLKKMETNDEMYRQLTELKAKTKD